MGKTVIIPPCNPIHFAQKDLVTNNQDGFHPFGSALYKHTLRSDQPTTRFYQPFNRADKVPLHIHFTQWIGDYAKLHFYDEDGTLLKTVDFDTPYQILSGNVFGAEQLITAQVQFTFSQYSELNDSDKIYLRMEVGDDEGALFYTSEMIELAEAHSFTSWLQFSNTINDYGVLFEQFRTVFGVRVPSKGMVYEPAGEYSVMEDQKKQLVRLYAQNCNTFKWDIGGRKGIPEYLVKIIDEAMQMDFIRIDGRDYIREEGATLERVGSEGTPLQGRSILLRQARNEDSYTHSESFVRGWERPVTSYPYAHPGFILSDGLKVLEFYPRGFDNSVVEDVYISDANAQVANENIAGFFTEIDGVFGFQNGPGEKFTISSTTAIKSYNYVPVLTDCLTLTLEVNDVVNPWTYDARDEGYHIIQWGDGIVHVHNYELDSSGFKIVTRSHVYAGLGAKTVRIYTDNTMNWLQFNAGQQSKITNIEGRVSNGLKVLRILAQDFSALAELDIDFLLPATNALSEFQIYQSGLVKIKAGWAGTVKGARYKYCTIWNLWKNAMTTANINAFASEFRDYAAWKFGGSMDIRQTPAAPPTGFALIDVNFLKASGFGVLHD